MNIFNRLLFICLILLSSIATIHAEAKQTSSINKENFLEIRQMTLGGSASINDILYALTYDHKEELTNFIHSLYAMRWHRSIRALLHDIWNTEKKNYPDLAWDLISNPPVRIALASTINRIEGNLAGTEFRNYIRAFKYHENSFIRAQSIIALGLNQNPNDISYLVEMAESDDKYSVQVSISALAFMSHDNARDALKKLARKYYKKPRGLLIEDVLLKAYNISISEEPLETNNSENS